MEPDECADIHIADAVPVGKTKRRAADVVSDTLQTPTGHRFLAGVRKRDCPWFSRATMKFHPVSAQINRQIALVRKTIEEVVLDDFPLVSAADHEFIEAVMGIDSHYVPDDGTPADLHQRFWDNTSFLAEPRAIASCQNDHLHDVVSFASM